MKATAFAKCRTESDPSLRKSASFTNTWEEPDNKVLRKENSIQDLTERRLLLRASSDSLASANNNSAPGLSLGTLLLFRRDGNSGRCAPLHAELDLDGGFHVHRLSLEKVRSVTPLLHGANRCLN